MITLNPSESFPILRVLKDHTDTNTYYVRCVIRDATTDALLDTVNLTDKGDRRFSKLYKVPYDAVYGKGRFIIITTSVFTDSAYTTKSLNHSEEAETYLVQQRWDPLFSMGGGAGVDYKEIKKIISEALDGKKIEPSYPVILKQNFPIKEIIKSVSENIDKAIKNIPKPEKLEMVDMKPMERSIETMGKEMIKVVKDIPPHKMIDLSPISKEVSKEIQNLRPLIEKAIQQTQDKQVDILNYFEKNKKEFVSALTEIIANKVIEKIKNENVQSLVELKKSKRDNYLSSLKSQFT